MSNPFRQLLERLLASPEPTDDRSGFAPDPGAENEPIGETVPNSDEPTLPEQADAEPLNQTRTEFHRDVASPTEFDSAGPTLAPDNPHSDPLPADVPAIESSSLYTAPASVGNPIGHDAFSRLSPIAHRTSNERQHGAEVADDGTPIVDPLMFVEEPIAPVSSGVTLASLMDTDPDWRSSPRMFDRGRNATSADSGESSAPAIDPSFAARLQQLLETFERAGHEQDQTRTLERLEAVLQRIVASRQDLSRFAERLDQLETAHVLRGRL